MAISTTTTTQSPTTPTRFLIISDTHDSPNHPFRGPTPKLDVVLHCGDLTQLGSLSEYKRALKILFSIPAELRLVIAGNHDLSLDPRYHQSLPANEQESKKEEHEQALEIMTGKLAKEAGVTYLTEGLHTFTIEDRCAV